jgi:hypothetical protein
MNTIGMQIYEKHLLEEIESCKKTIINLEQSLQATKNKLDKLLSESRLLEELKDS